MTDRIRALAANTPYGPVGRDAGRPIWIGLFVVLATLAGPSRAWPQESTDASAQAQLNALYESSKSAETVDDFSQLLAKCEGVAKLALSEGQQTYLSNLSGWLHNKRGESLAAEAIELRSQGQDKEADQRDARAMADFETAIQRNAQHWKAYHNRGFGRAMRGEFDQAILDFDRVIELRPTYVKSWFNRAELKYEMGNYEDSIRDYSEVLRLDSRDVEAFTRRGHAYFQLRQFRAALNDYNQVVRLRPQSGEALADRGDAYRSLAMWDQAARDYQRALQLDSELGRAYQSTAWLMATCPEARYRDAQRAVQAAQRAIELAGEDDFMYLDTLAAAYANAGDFEKAGETLQKAIRQAPETAAASLQQRLELYQNEQPYRQGMLNSNADGDSN